MPIFPIPVADPIHPLRWESRNSVQDPAHPSSGVPGPKNLLDDIKNRDPPVLAEAREVDR